MKRVVVVLAVLFLFCVSSKLTAQEASEEAKVKEQGAAEMSKAVTGAAAEVSKVEKIVVNEKAIMEIKRQIRLMREEMAELEEKLERMTSVREEKK